MPSTRTGTPEQNGGTHTVVARSIPRHILRTTDTVEVAARPAAAGNTIDPAKRLPRDLTRVAPSGCRLALARPAGQTARAW